MYTIIYKKVRVVQENAEEHTNLVMLRNTQKRKYPQFDEDGTCV